MAGDDIQRALDTPLLLTDSAPEHPPAPQLEAGDDGLSRKDLLKAAVAHVTDAMAYRDFSYYGDYWIGFPAKQLRSRLWLHHVYYEARVPRIVRSVAKIIFQVLIVFEQPPWCTSTVGGFHDGCTGLAKYHMSEVPHMPAFVSTAVELFCLSVFITEWMVRSKIHGREYFTRKWVQLEAILLALNTAGMITRFCIIFMPSARWLLAPVYLRAILRVPLFVLRSRRHRRDVFGVVFAGRQIIVVLISIAAMILLFAWAGFVLFSPTYQAAGEPPSVDVDLSSFPRALQSFFTLLTSANFPDVMLPAFNSNRLTVLFFFLFVLCGSWLGQALVLASVFAAFKEGAMEHFDLSTQKRKRALARAYRALKAAAGRDDTLPAQTFEEFAGMLHHALFKEHPHLLRNLADSNNDGLVSEGEFSAMDELLRLEETPPKIVVHELDPSHMPPARRGVWKLVTRPAFEWSVNLLIFANGILVGYESAELEISDEGQESFLLIVVDSLMIILFIAELICRCVAVGGLKQFWKGGGHQERFDVVVVVVLSAADVFFIFQCVFVYPIGKGSTQSLRLVRASLLLRMLRLVRLFRFSIRLQVLLSTMMSLLPLLLRFLRLLCLAALVYAVVGVAAFGGDVKDGAAVFEGSSYDLALGPYSYLPVNFNDVCSGLVALLCILVQNNWFVVQDAFVASSGSQWARVFFVSWWVCGVCVLLNVLQSFVLESFLSEWDKAVEVQKTNQSQLVVQDTAEGAVNVVVRQGGAVSEEEGGHHRLVLLQRQSSGDAILTDSMGSI